MNIRRDIENARNAILRFARRMLVTKRLMALMVSGVAALVGVVVLYYSDSRLGSGPWHTYADGLFSVNEPRSEHYDDFRLEGDFRRRMEARGGGRLLASFQKSELNDAGEVVDIRHINVFDLKGRFSHIFSTEKQVARAFLSRKNPYFVEYDIQLAPNVDGHPAMYYKSRYRDEGGYYARGMLVCAHRRAYFLESYSHYSPYLDWQNDAKTYFFSPKESVTANFTVDDMDSIENRFFCWSLFLFACYVAAGALAFRMVTRGIIHHGPVYPVVNFEAHRRWQWLAGLTIVMMLVMLVMLVAFWQYKGTTALQTAAFVACGLLIYSVFLPTSIHLYKKRYKG